MDSILTSMMSLVARKTRLEMLAECTIDTCPIDSSYYFYRVSLAANATFIALFAISLIGFLVTYAVTRRATAFTFAVSAGVILEVIGYAGRIMSWKNQWEENGFLMQIVCLTIAPAFIAGGIYLCLRRIVYAFGPENSRIAPETYTRFVCNSYGHTNQHLLTIFTVHSLRSPFSPPPSSRWRHRLIRLPPTQIHESRRPHHGRRSRIPSPPPPHLHGAMRRLRDPHTPPLQVPRRGSFRSEPSLRHLATFEDVQGLSRSFDVGYDLYILEKCV